MSAAGMIELTIDGKTVQVPPGTTVFDAARMNGITIPTLCHLQSQTPVGVCRLCVVDTGARVLGAACVRPVEPNMKVQTNSEKVLAARKTLLELLMSDHPSPCARQENSGDCELETLAKEAGVGTPRFPRRTISRGHDDSSLAIAVDHDACILCDRCIRGCDEIKNNFVLGRMGKGYSAGVAFDLNAPMGDSTCISCGECMVSCPTGALTNRGVAGTTLAVGTDTALTPEELHKLPVFAGVSGTFLELNRGAIVKRRFRKGDVITILHAPSFEVSSVDRKLVHTPLYWSLDAAAEGLSRSEPGFRTGNLLGRFDLNPVLSLPLSLRGWSFRPELSLRNTLYTQQLMPGGTVGAATSNAVNRKALEGSVEMRPPSLARVFERAILGRKWKHVIEPRATYRYVTGVNNFASILRFDARDLLSNTHEVEYGVIHRLYAKRTSDQPEDCGSAGMSSLRIGAPVEQGVPWERTYALESPDCEAGPEAHEVATWELAQKYFLDPDFGGALVNGRRNVLTTTADFSGIAFLTEPRHLSPLISRLRVRTSSRTDAEWDIDYDFKEHRINASTALLNYHVGEFTLGGGDAFAQALPGISNSSVAQQDFNQFRVLLGYGHPNKRGFSGATAFGLDANLGFLQYATAQTTYNWDCCGVSVEYRRFALGSVRNENQFRFSFNLANVGSFGNLRKQERLY